MTDLSDHMRRTIEDGLRSLEATWRDSERRVRERRAKLDLALAQQRAEYAADDVTAP